MIGVNWKKFFYDYLPVPLPCSLEKILLLSNNLTFLPKGLLNKCPGKSQEIRLLNNPVSYACDNKSCSDDGDLRSYLITQVDLSAQNSIICPLQPMFPIVSLYHSRIDTCEATQYQLGAVASSYRLLWFMQEHGHNFLIDAIISPPYSASVLSLVAFIAALKALSFNPQ